MNRLKKSDNFLAESFRFFQKVVNQAGPAAGASYTLIGAVLSLSLVGYFLDKYFNSDPWLLFVGILLGLIVGFYELAKSIWSAKE